MKNREKKEEEIGKGKGSERREREESKEGRRGEREEEMRRR
jgi:hypothetical protein